MYDHLQETGNTVKIRSWIRILITQKLHFDLMKVRKIIQTVSVIVANSSHNITTFPLFSHMVKDLHLNIMVDQETPDLALHHLLSVMVVREQLHLPLVMTVNRMVQGQLHILQAMDQNLLHRHLGMVDILNHNNNMEVNDLNLIQNINSKV